MKETSEVWKGKIDYLNDSIKQAIDLTEGRVVLFNDLVTNRFEGMIAEDLEFLKNYKTITIKEEIYTRGNLFGTQIAVNIIKMILENEQQREDFSEISLIFSEGVLDGIERANRVVDEAVERLESEE